MLTQPTEAEILEAVEAVARRVPKKLALPGEDECDLRQESRLISLKLVADGRYDPARGNLAGFLWRGTTRLLLNRIRDRVRRVGDEPCEQCHRATLDGTMNFCTGLGSACEEYVVYKQRNDAKANVQRLSPLEYEPEARGSTLTDDEAGVNELVRLVDEKLEMGLRADLLRVRAGVPVPKPRRLKVEAAVRAILNEESGASVDGD